MKEELKQLERMLAEGRVLMTMLEAHPGHRAALARGAVDGSIETLRQAKELLSKGESGVWTKQG